MPTQPANRAARRSKPAAKKAAPTEHVVKPKPQEKRITELETQLAAMSQQLAQVTYLHAELSVFIKAYIARDMAAKMAPSVQGQLEQKIMAQMNGGLRL